VPNLDGASQARVPGRTSNIACEVCSHAALLLSCCGIEPRAAGKTAMVTGGARGIGRAVAAALSREGAHVHVADMLTCFEASALELDDADEAQKWTWHVCDCGSALDIERLCAALGPIDVLVNNVAVQPEAPCHEHALVPTQRPRSPCVERAPSHVLLGTSRTRTGRATVGWAVPLWCSLCDRLPSL
jgi:hypothetical protein